MPSRSAPTAPAAPTAPVIEHRNQVAVVGRLSAAPERRALPSGDEVATWRLVVERPVGSPGQAFDVLDCAAWGARVRRLCAGWQRGDLVEASGALRRRFWRSPGGGVQSRCEVAVDSATRLATADGRVSRRRTRA
jgi:single-strand DNA-binding protein